MFFRTRSDIAKYRMNTHMTMVLVGVQKNMVISFQHFHCIVILTQGLRQLSCKYLLG
jgi:hypothetical protein